MFIRRLELTSFRNYARLEMNLSARIHMLIGDNAQGKTNLLEAAYYLATTRTPLAGQDRELIGWRSNDEDPIPNAQLALEYVRDGEMHTLEASLVREPSDSGVPGEDTFRRQLRHDGVNRRAMDIVGKLNVVLFLPEDILLVSGPPAERRRYLDVFLCQLDSRYCRTLSGYNRVLTQRNALLRRIREGSARQSELGYWDTQLAHLGSYVMARRLWAVSHLDPHACEAQRALTGGQESLHLCYDHTLAAKTDLSEVEVQLCDPERAWGTPEADEAIGTLEQRYTHACEEARREELARAVTVLGPHRDDLRFMLNDYDARVYGSRGQQRTAALALKLAEVTLMHQSIGDRPVLLLDDVLSELDPGRGRYVLERVGEAEQVVLTSTALSEVPESYLAEACVWQVRGGTVTPWEMSTQGT